MDQLVVFISFWVGADVSTTCCICSEFTLTQLIQKVTKRRTVNKFTTKTGHIVNSSNYFRAVTISEHILTEIQKNWFYIEYYILYYYSK